jgi:hypothetical protein
MREESAAIQSEMQNFLATCETHCIFFKHILLQVKRSPAVKSPADRKQLKIQ